MPKILLYITAKVIWQFLFWNTDYNENRAHVHVGKRSTEHLCKIWLEPVVELDKQGDLTDAQHVRYLKLQRNIMISCSSNVSCLRKVRELE